MLSVGCLSVSPVCDVGVLWPNGWTDHNETWHTGRPGLGPGHIVLDGNLAPPPHKGARGRIPQFSAHNCCGQMAGWIKMRLSKELGLSPSDIVLDRDPAPPPLKGVGAPPPKKKKIGPYLLWPNGWIYQDATWYGGRPQLKRHCVVGTQLAFPKGGEAPNFCPYLLWPNSWMDQNATWHGGRSRPRPHCARWGPSFPSPKKGAETRNFRPMSIVAKRLDGSRCYLVRR